MINMDMIGRVREGKVIVGGAATGSSFPRLLARMEQPPELELDRSGSAVYGSSDHTSFLTARVPVLFFFSGLHADYHRPTDTWDKIDVPNTLKLLDVIGGIVETLAQEEERPQFVKSVGVHITDAEVKAVPDSADKKD